MVDVAIVTCTVASQHSDSSSSERMGLLCLRRPARATYRFSIRCGAHVDDTLLLEPYPQSQRRVEYGVDNHSAGCVVFCALEAELVVPEKAGGSDQEGGVAQAQADIGEGVGLLELQGIQVVGNRIIRGVLEICSGVLASA